MQKNAYRQLSIDSQQMVAARSITTMGDTHQVRSGRRLRRPTASSTGMEH